MSQCKSARTKWVPSPKWFKIQELARVSVRVSSLVPSKKSQINFQKKKKICSIFGAKIQNYMKLILLVRMHIETFLMILKHYDNQFLTPSVKGPQWGCIGFAFCLTFCVESTCELRRDWGLISSLCQAFVEAHHQRENAHCWKYFYHRVLAERFFSEANFPLSPRSEDSWVYFKKKIRFN